MKAAYQDNNLSELKSLRKLSELKLANIQKLEKEKANLPSAYVNEIDKGKGLWGNRPWKGDPATNTEGDILQPRLLGYDDAEGIKNTQTYSFTGIGYTGGMDGKGGIQTIKNFSDVQPGQKVTVSRNTQVYDLGNYKNLHEFTNKARENDYFWMRAPKGEEITITVI